MLTEWLQKVNPNASQRKQEEAEGRERPPNPSQKEKESRLPFFCLRLKADRLVKPTTNQQKISNRQQQTG